MGCATCANTGYRGRIPLVEVLVSNPQFAELVATAATPPQLQKAVAIGGYRTLRDCAVERVRKGETTLQEVERVVGEVGDADEATTKSGEEVPSAPPVPHVLLVDDDPINRALARTLLQKTGFRVSEAADGAAGLALLEADPGFTLMVLDLEMPVLGGREVLARVRHSAATAGLPVIVLTGSPSEELEAQLMEDGAHDYVRKPLEPARFVARIKAALRRAGAAEALTA